MTPFILLGQPTQFAFQQYSTEHGLPNEEVTAIVRDKRGFMWFGTLNGLARFDGLRFKSYKRTGKSDALIGNYIIGLTLDADGQIWVSTHRGLNRLDPISERFEAVRLPTQNDKVSDNDYVSKLVIDKQGFGWFATAQSLYRINLITKAFSTYPVPSPDETYLPTPYIDQRGQFWLMRGGVLYRFNSVTRRYTHQLGQRRTNGADLQVLSLFEDHRKQLWVTTWEKGLLQYDSQHGQFMPAPNAPKYLTNMAEDFKPDGTPFFWLGNAMQGNKVGLHVYDPATGRDDLLTSNPRDPLSYNGGMVGCFYRDAQTGVFWIGSERGIYKIDPFTHKFSRKLIPESDGQSTPHVSFVRQDQRNPAQYWVGVSDGRLYQWNRQTDTFSPIVRTTATQQERINNLIQDRYGHLWLVTSNGLQEYDSTRNRWLPRLTNPAANQTIRAAIQDRVGRIWIGGYDNELLIYDPDQQTTTTWPLPISADSGRRFSISRLQEDGQGRIWAATSQGLLRIDVAHNRTDKITLHPIDANIQPSDGLHSTFYVDSKGRLWVSGIGFLAQTDQNGRVLKTYTLQNGLQGDHLFDMREDQNGNLWFTTDNLLHQLNPATGAFRYYGKENGLFSNFVNSDFSVDGRGEFFIGAVNAFVHFKPEQLRYNQIPPPLAITSIKVGKAEQRYDSVQPVIIPPDENVFSLDFAALNYSQAEKNRYAYQLVGFDDDWVTTNDRTATYMNLEPGTYTFRVKAANNDGVWNEKGIDVTIRVVPPYWKTWWFRLLCAVGIIGILYATYQYRERQRLRLEGIRNRIATDLHDDMGSTLSSIRIFSDVVQHQIAPVRPEAVPILQRISSSATTLSESMQDIIWTIQTKQDSLQDVVTRMREFGLRIAEAKDVEYHMEVSDQFQSPRLNVEQRRNIYLIFKESINNAIKYADCSRIDVCLSVTGKQLRLLIKDNGKGFDPAAVRQGNGLPNLEKRAREIRGKLTLNTAPGKGTEIELLMRLTS